MQGMQALAHVQRLLGEGAGVRKTFPRNRIGEGSHQRKRLREDLVKLLVDVFAG